MKVEAIHVSTAMPTMSVKDEWYDRIYNGCQSHHSNFPGFIVKNNILYRYCKSKYNLTREFDWKEIVPKGMRSKIITENHCEPTAGHLVVFKTHRWLCLRYYSPGMHKDVLDFVEACDICRAYKRSTQATLGLMGKPKVCSKPFQVVSLDLVGALPRS